MKSLTLESSPAFILLCVLISVGYALLLYQSKHPWSKNLNRALFAGRAVLVFLLSFLLLGPILKQIKNSVERPVFVVVHDNSVSVKEATDSSVLITLGNSVQELNRSLTDQGYDVVQRDLAGEVTGRVVFQEPSSDLQGALRKIANQYEGKSIGGVLLLSDGIYNTGLSPLYASYNFPVYTVGVGDTSQRQDISVKDLIYNKIAYQGNKFPIRAEILVKGFSNQNVSVSLLQGGKLIERVAKNSGNDQLLVVDFSPVAAEQGIQRFDVQVEIKNGEQNARNNRATAFVEVVEGKKKILAVASAPHPDLKALRSVIEKNSNYDFLLHVPGISETESKNLQPAAVDLVIFHQVPDKRGRMRELFQRFAQSKTSLFIVVGQQSDLTLLAQLNMPVKFEQTPRQMDDVVPVINPAFTSFLISPEASSLFANYPPVWVPFGRLQIPASVSPLLYQRVGNLATEKPLLWTDGSGERKVAVMLAEGFWQWRLQEYEKTESTDAFDEIFGKLVQYLSTTDDKRKFRSYPVEQQFSDTETVVFESQVYNEIFEPVFGNTISLSLTDEASKKYQYSYVISPGNARYEIGGLNEGVYRYLSSTVINGKTETIRGQFLVTAQQAELQNLTADFDLLRKLSASTGGTFYNTSEIEKLKSDFSKKEATGKLHSEEQYDSMLNLKWVFFVLLVLASAEWFLRKFYGGY